MPIVTIIILECSSMSSPPNKASEFNTQRIGSGFKWSKRMIAYQQPICIATKLSAGCPVLEVIFSIVFGHVTTFNKGV